jgi:Ca-activated chloride channel family protein
VNGKKLKLVLLILLITMTRPAFAESAKGIVDEGNKLYQQGQYQEAISQYENAMTKSPQAAEPRFNKANSYYRLDDLQQAIDLYKAVAAESKDMQLVEKAKYNLGDCYFRQGMKQKDADLQKAIENMQTAIGWWRQTLDIDPANENAAKNIEVARLTIKDIIDQINKQEQQQEQQQQQQKQNQEDLKKLLEQQKALADKTQQESQKPNADYNDVSKEQNQLKDKTEQVKQQLGQQNDPNKTNEQQQKATEQLDKATDKQKDAEEKLQKSDAEGAKKSQDEAAKNIEDALKELSEKQKQNQQADKQQQQQEQQQAQTEPNQPAEPNVDSTSSPQAAKQQPQQEVAPDATAEEILDREQRLKDQRQMIQSSGFQKVDKDW